MRELREKNVSPCKALGTVHHHEVTMVAIVHTARQQPKAYGEKGSHLSAQLRHTLTVATAQVA